MFEQNLNSPRSLPFETVAVEASDIFLLPPAPQRAPEWLPAEEEGQLAVDVIETETELVVCAPMAGTHPDAIELHLHDDVLTIRGTRTTPHDRAIAYPLHECYWGRFSRTIVLPVDVKGELAQSEYRYGLLTIRFPKAVPNNALPILVIEE